MSQKRDLKNGFELRLVHVNSAPFSKNSKKAQRYVDEIKKLINCRSDGS